MRKWAPEKLEKLTEKAEKSGGGSVESKNVCGCRVREVGVCNGVTDRKDGSQEQKKNRNMRRG